MLGPPMLGPRISCVGSSCCHERCGASRVSRLAGLDGGIRLVAAALSGRHRRDSSAFLAAFAKASSLSLESAILWKMHLRVAGGIPSFLGGLDAARAAKPRAGL